MKQDPRYEALTEEDRIIVMLTNQAAPFSIEPLVAALERYFSDNLQPLANHFKVMFGISGKDWIAARAAIPKQWERMRKRMGQSV
jgi:hypothetical protein